MTNQLTWYEFLRIKPLDENLYYHNIKFVDDVFIASMLSRFNIKLTSVVSNSNKELYSLCELLPTDVKNCTTKIYDKVVELLNDLKAI